MKTKLTKKKNHREKEQSPPQQQSSKNIKKEKSKTHVSADDSYLQRLPQGIFTSDVMTSSLTTPRRPIGDKLSYNLSLSLNPTTPSISAVTSEINLSSPERMQQLSQSTHLHPESVRYDRIMSPLRHKDTHRQESEKHHHHHQKYPSLPSEWMKTPVRPPGQQTTAQFSKTDHSATSSVGTSYIPPLSDDYTFDFHKFSWRKFLLAEIFGIGDPGHLEPMAVEAIDNFISVPWELEKLLFFGFIITLDSFLYTITYLPIRFFLATLLLIDEYFGYFLTFRPFFFVYLFLTSWNLFQSLSLSSTYSHSHHHKYQFEFTSLRQFDLMRGFLLIIGSWALSQVNMSWLYHYIRMQNTIKLYALTAMMEIFDKLFSSFGIDALDSLFWKTRVRSSYSTLILSFLITLTYVLVHSSLYFAHVSTLIVAINNADQSLLTILILNNFAEIKSFVLKKFDEESLYQLVCSDIYERFKIVLFSFLIFLISFSQSSSTSVLTVLSEYGLIFFWMISSEMIVDWIKHAFIVKLNCGKTSVSTGGGGAGGGGGGSSVGVGSSTSSGHKSIKLSSKSYQQYHKQLRYDIFYGQKDKITLDHSYAVTKTIGIAQYPLGCIFFRFIMISLYSSKNIERLSSLSFSEWIVGIGLVMVCLVLFKVMLSMGLIYYIGMKNNRDIQEEIERKNKEINDQKKWEEIQSYAQSGSGSGSGGGGGGGESLQTIAESKEL
jgi:uncharacterized membrane protein YgcG